MVIDELGYLTLNSEQINALFKLMGERYGKTSTIITTNLDYPNWYDLFQRKSLVDALLDLAVTNTCALPESINLIKDGSVFISVQGGIGEKQKEHPLGGP